MGVIAQDVQQVLPEIVHEMTGSDESSKKSLGVNYVEMVPLLLEAIRELDIRTSSMIAPVPASSSPASSSSSSSRKRRKLAGSSVSVGASIVKGPSDTTTIVDADFIGKDADSRRKDDIRRIDTQNLAGNTTLTATTTTDLSETGKATTTTAALEAEKDVADMNCGDLQAIIQGLRRRVVAIERDSNTMRRRLATISPITIR